MDLELVGRCVLRAQLVLSLCDFPVDGGHFFLQVGQVAFVQDLGEASLTVHASDVRGLAPRVYRFVGGDLNVESHGDIVIVFFFFFFITSDMNLSYFVVFLVFLLVGLND